MSCNVIVESFKSGVERDLRTNNQVGNLVVMSQGGP
jgi:hypothetical protein